MSSYTIIIDSHIHLYRQFDLSLLLNSAYANMKSQAKATESSGNVLLVLGLSSTSQEISWRELHENCDKREAIAGKGGEWRLSRTDDDTLLCASNPTGGQVYLLCGRQLVTSEKLELLTLGTDSPVYDATKGLVWHVENNLSELLVIPWAVGKWLGSRGAIVSEVIRRYSDAIHLGDNGGRPAFWYYVRQFKEVAQSTRVILPGTDPLPLPGQERAVGLNTITVEGVHMAAISGKNIVTAIRANHSTVSAQARRENPISFFYNQLRLRLPVH